MSLAGCSRSSSVIGRPCGEAAVVEKEKSNKLDDDIAEVRRHRQQRDDIKTVTIKLQQRCRRHRHGAITTSHPFSLPRKETRRHCEALGSRSVWLNNGSVRKRRGCTSFNLLSISLLFFLWGCCRTETNIFPHEPLILQGLTYVRGKSTHFCKVSSGGIQACFKREPWNYDFQQVFSAVSNWVSRARICLILCRERKWDKKVRKELNTGFEYSFITCIHKLSFDKLWHIY